MLGGRHLSLHAAHCRVSPGSTCTPSWDSELQRKSPL